MSNGTTLERVTTIFGEVLGLDPADIKPWQRFDDDLNGDSLDRLEVVWAVEESFGTPFTDADEASIHCVDDAVRCVERILSETKEAPRG